MSYEMLKNAAKDESTTDKVLRYLFDAAGGAVGGGAGLVGGSVFTAEPREMRAYNSLTDSINSKKRMIEYGMGDKNYLGKEISRLMSERAKIDPEIVAKALKLRPWKHGAAAATALGGTVLGALGANKLLNS